MAAILQGKETVFETDQFAPLIALGEELSGRRYGESFEIDRALRILADHGRAATFLIADGVVPSNEDRGYVLRRIMRRAILQGRKTLALDPGFLQRYQSVVTEIMGHEYGQLVEHGDSISKWLSSEEEGFGRTLDEGTKLLDDLIERARNSRRRGHLRRRRVPAARHPRLPDRPDARARHRARPGRRRGRVSRR